jgi:hypothetical protein
MDCINAKDKIIHLLYAGYVCNFLDECINECKKTYGEQITLEAINIFNSDYKPEKIIV